jgi:chromosomal replication initiator protein
MQSKTERIINAVELVYDVPYSLMNTKTRKREIVEARQVAMYYLYKLINGISLKSVGELFGGRDHSTVIHARQTVEDLMTTDKAYRAKIEEVEAILNVREFNLTKQTKAMLIGYLI